MTLAMQVIGLALAVAGVACWSVPAALLVAGVTLFVAGGFAAVAEKRQAERQR